MALSNEEANAERTNDGRIRDRFSLITGVLRENLGLNTDSEDSNSNPHKLDETKTFSSPVRFNLFSSFFALDIERKLWNLWKNSCSSLRGR